MRPNWLKLACLAQKICTLFTFSSLLHSLFSNDNLFKNIFDFTTDGDMDCVAAAERLPAFHYSVDFICLSFGIMDSIVEL